MTRPAEETTTWNVLCVKAYARELSTQVHGSWEDAARVAVAWADDPWHARNGVRESSPVFLCALSNTDGEPAQYTIAELRGELAVRAARRRDAAGRGRP